MNFIIDPTHFLERDFRSQCKEDLGNFSISATNYLILPHELDILQFNSDINYLELSSDSISLRAQSHKNAPT